MMPEASRRCATEKVGSPSLTVKICPEAGEGEGILELLAEAQTWRGSTVEALNLYGNVGEEKQEQAEEREGEEDERQAAHFDLRF